MVRLRRGLIFVGLRWPRCRRSTRTRRGRGRRPGRLVHGADRGGFGDPGRHRVRGPAPPALRHRRRDQADAGLRRADRHARRSPTSASVLLLQLASARPRTSRSRRRRWRSRRSSGRRAPASRRSSTAASIAPRYDAARPSSLRRAAARPGMLEALSDELAASSRHRQPAHVSLWLREPADDRRRRSPSSACCCWSAGSCSTRRGAGFILPIAPPFALVGALIAIERAGEPDRLAVPGVRRLGRDRLRGVLLRLPHPGHPSPARCRAATWPRRSPGTSGIRRSASSCSRCCCSRTAACSHPLALGRAVTVLDYAGMAVAGIFDSGSRPSSTCPRGRCSRRLDETLRHLLHAARASTCSCSSSRGVSLVVRLRRSHGEERQQVKWFIYAVAFVMFALPGAAVRPGEAHGVCLFPLIPIAAAVAILKYRLYDIDVVINRTLVYGALTAILGGAYLASVLLLQLILSPQLGPRDRGVDARGRGAVPAGARPDPGAGRPALLPPRATTRSARSSRSRHGCATRCRWTRWTASCAPSCARPFNPRTCRCGCAHDAARVGSRRARDRRRRRRGRSSPSRPACPLATRSSTAPASAWCSPSASR